MSSSSKNRKKHESDSSNASDSENNSSDDSEHTRNMKRRDKKKKQKHSSSSSSSSDNEQSDGGKKRQKKKFQGEHARHRKSHSHSGSDADEKPSKTRDRKFEEQDKRYNSRDRGGKNDYRRYNDERRPNYDRDNKNFNQRRRYNDNRNRDNFRQDRISDRERNFSRGDRGRNRNDNWGRKRSPFHGDRRDDRQSGNRRRSRSRSFDHTNAKWGKNVEEKDAKDKAGPAEKQKPNFGLSGKLTEETNTYKGVVIKYSEPPEARKPRRRWRLYPFKGEKAMQTLYIHRESGYLIGRDRKVVDLPVDHPSCSKQHAALQYRLVPFTREDGSAGKRVRPYLIDLDSANGTFINNKKIEPKKYVELLERDVIKFGFSSREYVLLHENSKDEAMDDDVKIEEEEVAVKEENK